MIARKHLEWPAFWMLSADPALPGEVDIFEDYGVAVMNQPYYMIVNHGLGGYWPIDQTPARSTFKVKYVRVFAPQYLNGFLRVGR